MKVARAGQQSGNESTASANVVPCFGEQALDVRHVLRRRSSPCRRSSRRGCSGARPSAAEAGPRLGAAGRTAASAASAASGDRCRSAARSSRRERTACVTQCQLCMIAARWRRDPAVAARAADAHVRLSREQSRERIVAAATELVRKRSYAELSVDEVMREAGLGRTIFYRHFDDLGDLLMRASREAMRSCSTPSDASARRGPATRPKPCASRSSRRSRSTSATARCCARGRGRGRRRADRGGWVTSPPA